MTSIKYARIQSSNNVLNPNFKKVLFLHFFIDCVISEMGILRETLTLQEDKDMDIEEKREDIEGRTKVLGGRKEDTELRRKDIEEKTELTGRDDNDVSDQLNIVYFSHLF